MRTLLPDIKHCMPYVLLAGIIITLQFLPDYWQQSLRYSRTDIIQGEYWRLFSGHLLHSNYWHLLMNTGGVLLAMLLHASYFSRRQLAWQWPLSTVLISTALLWFSPDMHYYVGLSGVLHAMLMLGAVDDIQHKQRGGWLLALGLIAKVMWEQWQGPDATLAELINASVAIDAHLYGVLSGVLIAAVTMLARRVRKAQEH